MIQPVPYTGEPATLPLQMLRAEEQIRMRNGFDEESIKELAESIKVAGIIQPITVRPDPENEGQYIVIAGERRMLAASVAGLIDVPVIIRHTTKEEADVVQAIENLQREDLCLADTAEGVAKLVKHHKGVKGAAKVLGKSAAWVSKHASLAKMSPAVWGMMVERTTDDTELLLCLDQIARMKAEVAQAKFTQLVKGLEDGSTTRTKVREALHKLKHPQLDLDNEQSDEEGEGEGEGASEPQEKFGKLELAEGPARALLAALKFAQDKKPSSRPGEALIAHVEAFISKTWG